MTTKTKLALLLGLSLGLFSFVGVGAAADQPAAAGKPAIAGKPAVEAAPTVAPKLPPRAKIDWEKMSAAERKKYMKTTVLPEMKKLFVGVDKKYKSMTCMTCHGEKAADNKFKMPNPELPKLPAPTDRQGFMALQQKKPDVVKFMGTEVKPAMANLLNVDEWSPTNPKGFGCYGCHTQERGGAAAAPAPGAAPATPPKPAAKAAAPSGGGW
jgi:hypothetical protein